MAVELIGLEKCISDEFSENITFTVRSTLTTDPPLTLHAVNEGGDGIGETGGETVELSITASPLNDYRGISYIHFFHPDLNPPSVALSVEWIYIDSELLPPPFRAG